MWEQKEHGQNGSWVQDRVETHCAYDVLGTDGMMRMSARERWNGEGNTDQQQLAYLGRVGVPARRAASRLRNAGSGRGIWEGASTKASRLALRALADSPLGLVVCPAERSAKEEDGCSTVPGFLPSSPILDSPESIRIRAAAGDKNERTGGMACGRAGIGTDPAVECKIPWSLGERCGSCKGHWGVGNRRRHVCVRLRLQGWKLSRG
jgi:hypothetical protein